MKLEVVIAFIGVTGVILGVVLRPFFEELVTRRKNTILLELLNDQVGLTNPGGSGLKFEIAGKSVDRVFQRSFVVKNTTGRTLRDLKLEIELINKKGIADKKGKVLFFASNGVDYASFGEEKDDGVQTVTLTKFGRGSKFLGQVFSTYLFDMAAYTDQDIEVKVVDRSKYMSTTKGKFDLANLVILGGLVAYGIFGL